MPFFPASFASFISEYLYTVTELLGTISVLRKEILNLKTEYHALIRQVDSKQRSTSRISTTELVRRTTSARILNERCFLTFPLLPKSFRNNSFPSNPFVLQDYDRSVTLTSNGCFVCFALPKLNKGIWNIKFTLTLRSQLNATFPSDDDVSAPAKTQSAHKDSKQKPPRLPFGIGICDERQAHLFSHCQRIFGEETETDAVNEYALRSPSQITSSQRKLSPSSKHGFLVL